MSLPVAFRPEAEQELAQARDWYEARREGLGGEFARCVEAAISRAARGPESNACVHRPVRRALVRRFPNSVLYVVESDVLVVLAVAHGNRRPGYWTDRARE